MHTVTVKDDHNLLIMKAGTVFDYSLLREWLSQVYVDEDGKLASYDRFADLSSIEEIDVDIDTVVETVQMYRKMNPPSNGVKAAVLMPFGLTASFAQIFKLATESDLLFNVQIFNSIKECAEYLQVDPNVLNHSAS